MEMRALKIIDNLQIVEKSFCVLAHCPRNGRTEKDRSTLQCHPALPLVDFAELTRSCDMNMHFDRFATQDGQISAICAGPPKGPGVVLVHGLGWDGARLWAEQIGPLVNEGWRVLVPDLRGTGASAPLRKAVRIEELANDVATVIEANSMARPVLAGFSMGCMVAMDLALRPVVQAAGVVLACGGLRSTAVGAAETEAMLARARDLGPLAFAHEQADAIFGPSYRAESPAAVLDFIEWRAAMDQDSLHHSFRAPFGCNYEDRLASLHARVAVIAADTDAFLPLAAAQAFAARVGAACHIIKDSGHMAPVERPEAFATALRCALQVVTS
jgi:pimeloyl-ACP methyl ester carboxylesterase